ncbi:hypothetical protein E3N88_09174 [Mikania micrantha]|uniref:CW-type domain-containing protein n=1 Tax=Mikania micrantha TaxID=192012 RepID=A0A5N6PJ91_9ASTR|nr:hypothetical protein E3N88_09174 [Mikania micrantha]
MMLVHSLPTSIDGHGKQESSCIWLSGDESWQESGNPVSVTITKHNSKDNTSWSHNLISSSQLLTEINMSETPTLNYVYKRRMIPRNVLPMNPSSTSTLVYKRRKVLCDNSKSGFVDGEFIEDPKAKTKKCSGLHINDSCSSTKSNVDVGSAVLKQVEDAGECSSSSVVIMEGTNSCFVFSKQHGNLESHISTKKPTESFHMSCCNPAIKKAPVGDWFCNSCSRKKLKKMETNSSKLPESCLGPVASIEINGYLEPMELRPFECASYQEWDASKLSRLSSIGNWLQCREVTSGVDGSVCGKWRRRAPTSNRPVRWLISMEFAILYGLEHRISSFWNVDFGLIWTDTIELIFWAGIKERPSNNPMLATIWFDFRVIQFPKS